MKRVKKADLELLRRVNEKFKRAINNFINIPEEDWMSLFYRIATDEKFALYILAFCDLFLGECQEGDEGAKNG